MLRKGRKKRKKAELKEREFIYITTRKSVDTLLKLELNGRKFKEEFAIQNSNLFQTCFSKWGTIIAMVQL